MRGAVTYVKIVVTASVVKMKKTDLTGMRFGRLSVIRDTGLRNKSGNVIWECECDCGNKLNILGTNLHRGLTKSCGCIRREKSRERMTKHGKTNTRLFRIWQHMLSRCYTTTDSKYYCYGARGIYVCEEWKDDFEAFYNWAINNGYSEDLSIDRIDNDKGYSPENCRWADDIIQARNKSTNRIIEYNGQKKCLSEWEEILGIRASVISKRLKRGWSVEKAFENKEIEVDEQDISMVQLNTSNKSETHISPCPECGEPLIHEGGCDICKMCGYSKCS